MNHTCQSKGCHNEVLYKTIEGAFIDHQDRRSSRAALSPPGRGSPSGPYQRYGSSATQVSPYCKVHTCSHFYKNETCLNKKPPHDSVCAFHTRCPIGDCAQARGQYLDPNLDPLASAVPIYVRYDVCADHKCTVRQCPRRREPETPFCANHGCPAEGCPKRRQEHRDSCEDHQCKTRGCRTSVEGGYPYCAQHIKCGISGCGGTRHFVPGTNEYLESCTKHITCSVPRCREIKKDRSAFCENHTCYERDCTNSNMLEAPYCADHCCEALKCFNSRTLTADPRLRGRFCPLHNCRAAGCQEHVDSLSIFCQTHCCSRPKCHQESVVENLCLDHLRKHYITLGRRRAVLSLDGKKQSGHITPSSKTHESDSDSDSELSNGADSSTATRGRARPTVEDGFRERKQRLLHAPYRQRADVSEPSSDDDNHDEEAGPPDLSLNHDADVGAKHGSSVLKNPPQFTPPAGREAEGPGIERPDMPTRTSSGGLNGSMRRASSLKRSGGQHQDLPKSEVSRHSDTKID